MENDLSNEAYRKWHDEIAVPTIQLLATYTSAKFAEAAWQECRRRAEAILEIQDQQHIKTLAKVMVQNVQLIIDKKKLQEQLNGEREAFEAGYKLGMNDRRDWVNSEMLEIFWKEYNDRRSETTPSSSGPKISTD